MKKYTVGVLASPRHDGEKGWLYVVNADSMIHARQLAFALHLVTHHDLDLILEKDGTFEGTPGPPDRWPHYNDYTKADEPDEFKKAELALAVILVEFWADRLDDAFHPTELIWQLNNMAAETWQEFTCEGTSKSVDPE